MALTYPTGISAQPIDVTSGARAFMKSAVESRLNEIASSQERISENQKTLLKALSIRALPELAQEQRQRYSKEMDDYRKRIVDIYKEKKGDLGTPELMQIQDGFEDLQSRQMAELNDLKMFQQYRDKIYDPNFGNFYDTNKAEQILANKYSDLMQGKGIGNIAADFAQAQLPPDVGSTMYKFFGDRIKNLDTEVIAKLGGNIFSETSLSGLSVQDQESVAKARALVDDAMQQPNIKSLYTGRDGRVFEDKKQQVQQDIIDSISPRKTEVKPYKTETSSGTDRFKNAITYTPSEFEYKGEKWNLFKIPTDVSQTERNYFINKAKNVDTGKETQLTQDNSQFVGFDTDKGVIVLKSKGSFAQNNGKDVYVVEGSTPSKSDGRWQASTEEQLDKSDKERTLRAQYKGGRKIEKVEVNPIEKDENGNIVISGTLTVDKKGVGTGSEQVPVSITYTRFTDPQAEAVFEADMLSNKEAFASAWYKMLPNGKTLEQVYNELESKKEKQSDVPIVDKQSLLDEGYSEKQIQDAVKSGKIKLK